MHIRNSAAALQDAQLRGMRGKAARAIKEAAPQTDLPMFIPGSNIEQLKREMQKHASNPQTGGGAFNIVFGRKRASGQGKGSVRGFKCQEESCPWSCGYECVSDGWVLSELHPEHDGHELHKSSSAVATKSSGRWIPDEILQHLGAEITGRASRSRRANSRACCSWYTV